MGTDASIDRLENIRIRLVNGLAPASVTVEDESAQHAGHEGARSGGGHFRIRLVSPRFAGLPRIARHRLVYDLVADLMQTQIHALAITALTPEEQV